jgi:hypothetical protein
MRTSLLEADTPEKRNSLRRRQTIRLTLSGPTRCHGSPSTSRELFVRERVLLRLATDRWPAELTSIQAPGGQPDAETVVNQNFHAVSSAIGEQVSVVRMRSAEHLEHAR